MPSGVRVPTLNELRRLDREIFLEMGRHLSRGRGTLEDATRFYAEHKDEMIWRLVEPVPANLPDQGIDVGDQEHKDTKKADGDASKKRKLEDERKDEVKGKVCLICNKRHTPLCPIPPGWRKEQREAAKKAKRDKAASARGGGDKTKKAS